MGIAAYVTKDDFLGKIIWEGGVADALRYGLKSEDLADEPHHKELKSDWDALAVFYREWEYHLEEFEAKYLEGLDGW